MQFCCLFLVLVVAAVNAVIVVNSSVDKGQAETNKYLRDYRATSVHAPKGSYGSNLTFSDSDILGMDSLKRTNNCTLEIVDKSVTWDMHYGYGFYQRSFKMMNINGQEMSSSIRIIENSIHLRFTIQYEGARCHVSLHDLSYERFAKIDFSSSRPEYDGIDVEEYFEKEVVPFLNNKIDKAAVEKAIQPICDEHKLEVSEHMPMIHLSILKQIGFPSQF